MEAFQGGSLHEVFEEGGHSQEVFQVLVQGNSLERREIVELDKFLGKDLALHRDT
jgi:hypothetical protein